MKKYFKIFAMVALCSLSLASCESFLDINKNPNYPTEATCATLLPSVCASTTAYLGTSGEQIGIFFNQFCTQGNSTNQYNSVVNFSLTAGSFTAFWSNAYGNTLPDLKIMNQLAEEQGYWNYWVIGKVLEAYTWGLLIDLYEDVPFTEALNSDEFPYPNYDNGKTVVYPAILSMLDAAIAKAGEASAKGLPTIANKDYFFNGDMSKWIAFAKSLKLKMLMKDFNAKQSEISSLLSSGGLLATDCKMACWEDATDKGNPFYEANIRQLNTQENVRASHTFLEYMIANDDIRLNYIFEPTYKATQSGATSLRDKFEGLPYGTKPPTDGDGGVPITSSSRYLQHWSDPVYLMNAAESYFTQAEAYARLGQADKAKAAYDAGVLAGFARFGLDGSSYIAAGGAYEFDADNMIECIMLQKWVSYAKANGIDGWFDRNRTGYPRVAGAIAVRASDVDPSAGLTPGYELGTFVDPGETGLQPKQMPRRLMVPTNSSQYNPNAPETKELYEPMWWQVADGQ